MPQIQLSIKWVYYCTASLSLSLPTFKSKHFLPIELTIPSYLHACRKLLGLKFWFHCQEVWLSCFLLNKWDISNVWSLKIKEQKRKKNHILCEQLILKSVAFVIDFYSKWSFHVNCLIEKSLFFLFIDTWRSACHGLYHIPIQHFSRAGQPE